MNKDAILATVIGFGIGLCITALVFVGPKLMTFLPKVSLPSFVQKKSAGIPTQSPKPKEFGVTIDSPLPESIEENAEVLVSGTSMAAATVVIGGVSTDAVAKVTDDGKYAGKVSLVEGKNDIVVTSYLKDKQAVATVTVFYTPEEF